MTPTLAGLVTRATRRFVREGPSSLLIEDKLEINELTDMITWQLMTLAEVEITNSGIILHQNGQQLRLENLSHPDMRASVISLDPPPLELDRRIENLKRIEFRYPAYLFKDGSGEIRIRLSGD
jgi:hypothetical protein